MVIKPKIVALQPDLSYLHPILITTILVKVFSEGMGRRLGFPTTLMALSFYNSVTYTTQGATVETLRGDAHSGHEACGLHGGEVRALSLRSKDCDCGPASVWYWL